MSKSIAIVGLGLIGGSMAMALQGFEDYEIVGVDVSQPTLRFARENRVADRVTDNAVEAIGQADVVFLCLHPQGIIDFLADHRDQFKAGALVTDVCGVKKAIVEAARVLPAEVEFIGGHPMAGTEFSGVQNALKHMFHAAHYIIVPEEHSSPDKIALLERIAQYIGCSDVVRTTPEQHDAIIAYTSQMMHIIAVAVCDDPQLFEFMGFEGDSFRGCTRVAALDVPLWTQLFSLNAQALDDALEKLEQNIAAYRQVLRSGDRKQLAEKLEYSAQRKRRMNRCEAQRDTK
ncbi:MAG: prephenate dehydrogenase [Oscillospiraceae bacterium]|nr:prephenate dehydrogenase [Oscillospiraceae bacterium]